MHFNFLVMFTTGYEKLGSASGHGMRALMVQENNLSLDKKTDILNILHSKNVKQAPQSDTADQWKLRMMEK